MSEPKIIESETPVAVAGAAPCSASSWTVHWTSEDGMRPFRENFDNPNKLGKFVAILLKNGRTAISVMVNE